MSFKSVPQNLRAGRTPLTILTLAAAIALALGIGWQTSRSAANAGPDSRGSVVPVGGMIAYGGPLERLSANGDWLPCDGRELIATAYPELHAALGNAWGGASNGSTFRLPDLRGRFVRGVNAGASGMARDPDADLRLSSAEGGPSGDSVGTLQDSAVGPHRHVLAGVANAVGPGSGGEWVRFYANKVPDADAEVVMNSVAILSGEGTETRPANAAVHWIIRVR